MKLTGFTSKRNNLRKWMSIRPYKQLNMHIFLICQIFYKKTTSEVVQRD